MNGKLPQGFWPRQGLVKLSKASGNMWINPVARITPAAKALIMKKMLFSGFKVGIFLPTIGSETPSPLAIRIVHIATSLNFRASVLFLSSGWVSQLHSAKAERGRTRRRK